MTVVFHQFSQQWDIPLCSGGGGLLPLMQWSVSAGFPSPAEGEIERRVCLDDLLIHQLDATFIVRAKGSSMVRAGIFSGDLLVVDRSLNPRDGDIVVAVLDGHHTVKRLYARQGVVRLVAESEDHPDVELHDGQVCEIWGVVTSGIRQFRACA